MLKGKWLLALIGELTGELTSDLIRDLISARFASLGRRWPICQLSCNLDSIACLLLWTTL
ncbi:hypothetical protein CKO42_12255 [Lamprobacter modestohalophilus]|uniref:Uncharacterized protein n=1 Tax=Lamprobacter modestohalophilus TaxID=1064514 RepID=A0A9X0W900_9GAMM|nr:hypothetical protein [Lamprobacter modestohalophilus]